MIIALSMALLISLAVSPAQADEQEPQSQEQSDALQRVPQPRSQERSDILKRVADGQSTARDIAMIRRDRELAAMVIDPSKTETSLEVEATVPPEDGVAENPGEMTFLSSTTCKRWTMRIRHRSYLGYTIFRYNFAHSACYRNGVVTSIYNRSAWFDEQQSIVVAYGQVAGYNELVGTSRARAYSQGRAELCVLKYGCYANVYPWIRSTVTGSGAHSWAYGGVA